MLKLNAKFYIDLLLYSLSHFECDGHTVHILIQQHLSHLMTSTVKSSLFTHVHSTPLSFAARLHRCHANHSPLERPCMHPSVYCCIIHGGQDMKAIKVSFDRGLDKEDVIHMYNGIIAI